MAQTPVISGFSPAKGQVGSSVVITGSNFNPAPNGNVVYFGATRALVINATSTTLTVTVPVGATFKPITVLNTANHLTGSSRYPFHVIFPSKGTITKLDLDARLDLQASEGPTGIALGDLDDDGKVDMVVANRTSNTISIFRNTATPGIINQASFAAKFDIATNFFPICVEIADIDGDGKQDILVANNSSNNISIYKNKSVSGTLNLSSFEAKYDLKTATYP